MHNATFYRSRCSSTVQYTGASAPMWTMPCALSGARWLFDEKNPPKNDGSPAVVSRTHTQVPLEPLGVDTCAGRATAERQYAAAFAEELAVMA